MASGITTRQNQRIMGSMLLDKVSVIIPYVHDRGYLQEAMDSVHRQDYKGEIELILSQSNNGVSYNLNQGIRKATGKFITYLCDDDLLPNNAIACMVEAMRDFDFIHGNAINFHENGQRDFHIPRVKHPNINQLLEKNIIHGGTLMYRKSIFKKYGYFDIDLTTGEEYEYSLRLLRYGARIGYCDNFVYLYRRHAKQKSLGKEVDQKERAFKISQIKKKYADSSWNGNI